jgi:hypothetical protein
MSAFDDTLLKMWIRYKTEEYENNTILFLSYNGVSSLT